MGRQIIQERVADFVTAPLPPPFPQVLSIASPSLDEGCAVLATQHVQGSFIPLYRSLVKMGARPEQFHLIPKGYSSVPEVVTWLEREGVNIYGIDFDVCHSYERALERSATIALRAVLKSHPRVILIIDEGGRLTRLANRVSGRFRIAAVEQTTRGAVLAKSTKPRFPVINVAASQPKRTIEARNVAVSMVAGLQLSLELTSSRPLVDSTVSIIGCGAIGTQLARQLQSQAIKIRLFDREEANARELAKDLDCEFVRELTPETVTGDVILGATGAHSMGTNLANSLRQDAVFGNCGSSDIEFPSEFWRCGSRLAASSPDLAPWRRHYVRRTLGGSRSLLLCGGFPVNFQGQLDTVPFNTFLLTRGLMLAGVVQSLQALNQSEVGLIKMSEHLVRLVQECLDGRGSP